MKWTKKAINYTTIDSKFTKDTIYAMKITSYPELTKEKYMFLLSFS